MDIAAREQEADAAAGARDFARARAILAEITAAQPAYFGGWLKLSAMTAACGDRAGAIKALDAALAINPLDFTALLMRAAHLDALGQSDAAGDAYSRALANSPQPPPPSMATLLSMARDRYHAWQNSQYVRLKSAVTMATPLTEKLDRFITNMLRMTESDRANSAGGGPTHYCYPDLPEIGYYPDAEFPWLPRLATMTDAIAAECEAVIAAEATQLVPYIQYPAGVPIDQWEALNHNRDWTAVHLIQNGRVVDANARYCPNVMALLRALPQPDIKGAGPNAMFSLLAPGAHIPPHAGISNARLVCHLPLVVPNGCWFRVGHETREWQRGQPWIFDDTVEHEAKNPSDALRIVLIFDIWHPALDVAEQAGIRTLIEAGGHIHGL
jgi:hypothetical protein